MTTIHPSDEEIRENVARAVAAENAARAAYADYPYCPDCDMGTCFHCRGGTFNARDLDGDCPHCDGDGRCSSCHGEGFVLPRDFLGRQILPAISY
jgi:DnaJ-class molecular chaperone